jgi:hypothetical protein
LPHPRAARPPRSAEPHPQGLKVDDASILARSSILNPMSSGGVTFVVKVMTLDPHYPVFLLRPLAWNCSGGGGQRHRSVIDNGTS